MYAICSMQDICKYWVTAFILLLSLRTRSALGSSSKAVYSPPISTFSSGAKYLLHMFIFGYTIYNVKYIFIPLVEKYPFKNETIFNCLWYIDIDSTSPTLPGHLICCPTTTAVNNQSAAVNLQPSTNQFMSGKARPSHFLNQLTKPNDWILDVCFKYPSIYKHRVFNRISL